MNIVQVEDFFHPDAGYQINILSKYLVKAGHQVHIITSQLDKIPDYLTGFFGKENIAVKDHAYEVANGVHIHRVPIHAYLSGRAIYHRSIFSFIRCLKPDVLYVHGNDTYFGLRVLHNTKRFPCAIISDSHMLSMASNNRFNKLFHWFYRTFITPKIIKNNLQVIRTQNDDYVEKVLNIPLSQAPWISYGSDTLLFHPDETVKANFRKEHGIGAKDFVVIFTGKLDESKGGALLAETFKEAFSANRPVVLVVVGNPTTGEYGEKVEAIFQASQNRIIRFPTQKYADLAKFYQAADLCVFAKQCSLSFYDAQSCGVPVLSENNNINVDRCSHQNGWNFTTDSVDSFREKLEEILAMDSDSYQQVQKNATAFILQNYDYKKKAEEYIKFIQKVYDDYKGANT